MPNEAHDTWTSILIGHQWPADSTLEILDAGSRNRHALGTAFDSYAKSLRSTSHTYLGMQEGATAHHTREAFASGERHAQMLAEKNIAKKGALQQARSATTELRSQLAEIAERGKGRVRTILESKLPHAEKVAHLVDLVTEARGEANVRAAACGQAMLGSIQSVLDESRSDLPARQFAAMHGVEPAKVYAPTASESIRRDISAAVKTAGASAQGPEAHSGTAGPGMPGHARPLPPNGHSLRMSTAVTTPVQPASPCSSAPVRPAVLAAVVGGRTIPGSIATSDTGLRRLLEHVARQEPRLRWAIGRYPNGSILLATDLASGWVPPNIAIPVGVRLPTPADRIGSLTTLAAAATHSELYAPGDPLPKNIEPIAAQRFPSADAVDDLELRLVRAIRGRDGLPPLASTLARALCARTGFGEFEARRLTEHLRATGRSVVQSYPHAIDYPAIGNWQLLASLDALLRDEPLQAVYHFDWFQT